MSNIIDTEMASFSQFCVKRQLAYNGKTAGDPFPWTDDDLINTRRFTNVYRDLDAGSVWFFDRVPPCSIHELMMKVCTYRWINWVPTFEEVGLPNFIGHASIDEWCDKVDIRAVSRARVVTTRHNAFWKGTRERMHALSDLLDAEYVYRLIQCEDGVELVEVLSEVNGLGPFTAVQVAADLMSLDWTPWSPNTPIPLAIGSRFGLHILRTGEAPDKSTKSALQRQKGLSSQEYLDTCYIRASMMGEMPHSRDMNFIDIEHALCEWFRYRGTQIGAQTKLTSYEPAC